MSAVMENQNAKMQREKSLNGATALAKRLLEEAQQAFGEKKSRLFAIDYKAYDGKLSGTVSETDNVSVIGNGRHVGDVVLEALKKLPAMAVAGCHKTLRLEIAVSCLGESGSITASTMESERFTWE